jgi:hypothetical protein
MRLTLTILMLATLGCADSLHAVGEVSPDCYACPPSYKGAPLTRDRWGECEYQALDVLMVCEPVACGSVETPVCELVPMTVED